jgi:very-short-patch-repair endonuclease
MTDAEKKLWWHLRRLSIEESHFRRQAAIGPYFADFASHRYRLVIEVDGAGHGETLQAAYDVERTTFLQSRGYRVLRFWNNEVLTEIDAVMNAIYAALCRVAPPTPDPSPPRASRAGGGEKHVGGGEKQESC